MLWTGAVAIVYLERRCDTCLCCTTGELINTLEGHTDGVLAVAVAPDGETIVTGSGDKTARVWNRSTGVWWLGTCVHTEEGTEGTGQGVRGPLIWRMAGWAGA